MVRGSNARGAKDASSLTNLPQEKVNPTTLPLRLVPLRVGRTVAPVALRVLRDHRKRRRKENLKGTLSRQRIQHPHEGTVWRTHGQI